MDQNIDLRALVGIIRRQARLIALVVIAALAVALLALFTLRPAYDATALVLVDTSQKDILNSDNGTPDYNPDPRVDSEVQLVKSQTTLLNVVNSADLIHEPEFGPHLGLTDKVRTLLHLPTPPAPSGDALVRDILERLDSDVTAERVAGTFLIAITARTGDPALSAKIANAVASNYIADQRQAKVDSVLASRNIIQSRLADANASVANSEEAIDSFINANFDAISHGTGNTDLVGIRDKIQKLQNEEVSTSARVDLVAKGVAAADWTQVAATLQSQAAASLAAQREDLAKSLSGPSVDAAQADTLKNQISKIESQLREQANGAVTSLKAQIDADKSQTADLRSQMRDAAVSGDMPPALLTNLYELQQNAQIARTQYQALIARQKDLETQAYLQVADARMVSEAVPPGGPSFPNSRLIFTFGALAGLGLGLAAALLRENFVGGFTSLGQVQSVLRVPAVAAIPWQRPFRNEKLEAVSLADMLTQAPLSAYSEAIRMVQVGVDQARRRQLKNQPTAPQQGAVVLISSTNPGEGKTTIALSLARAFVASGRTTLLIDADLRVPRLHQSLQMEPSAGLVDYLMGRVDSPRIDEIIVSDPQSALRVIVGARRSDAPTDRLINNEALSGLLAAARKHFDMVVIDTPPVGAVVDGFYLAGHADVIVFALKWASTAQLAARSAVGTLRDSLPEHGEIVAVLNQERLGRRRRGGSYEDSYYYG